MGSHDDGTGPTSKSASSTSSSMMMNGKKGFALICMIILLLAFCMWSTTSSSSSSPSSSSTEQPSTSLNRVNIHDSLIASNAAAAATTGSIELVEQNEVAQQNAEAEQENEETQNENDAATPAVPPAYNSHDPRDPSLAEDIALLADEIAEAKARGTVPTYMQPSAAYAGAKIKTLIPDVATQVVKEQPFTTTSPGDIASAPLTPEELAQSSCPARC